MNRARPTPAGTGRFRLRVALLVALGVFAQESVWNFHDAQTPATLAQYTTNTALIGLVMGLDNILGIFVQPFMGHASDRTRSRWGRRTPYIVVGVPIAAVLFALIPFASTLPMLILFIVLFALTANSFKPITESLIADVQSPGHRSKANALAKMATSLTIIVSSLLSLLVVDRSVELAYAIAAGVMVLCAAIVVLSLREWRRPEFRAVIAEDRVEGTATIGFRRAIGDILTSRDRSRLFLIIAVVVTWGAWSASRSLLTLYGLEHLGMSRGEAGSFSLPAGLAYLVAAFPIAVLSDRVSRRVVMRIGLVVFIIGALVAFIGSSVTLTYVGVLILAVGFAGFSINAIVVLWNLAPTQRLIGLYTAVFSVMQAIGSSFTPAGLGALIDATNWGLMMLYVAGIAGLGLLFTIGIRHEYAESQLAEKSFIDAETTV